MSPNPNDNICSIISLPESDGGIAFNTVVLNLWVVILLGSQRPFHRGCISGIWIMIHKSSKRAVMK